MKKMLAKDENFPIWKHQSLWIIVENAVVKRSN